MDQFEYAFSVGLSAEEIDRHLRAGETGVLSLADGGDAYGLPLAYHWDGEAFVFRLGKHPDSEKMAFIDATERASFLVYHYTDPDDSWSVLATGRLRELPATEAAGLEAREDFLPLRLFGEAVPDIEPVLYELEVDTLTGRTT